MRGKRIRSLREEREIATGKIVLAEGGGEKESRLSQNQRTHDFCRRFRKKKRDTENPNAPQRNSPCGKKENQHRIGPEKGPSDTKGGGDGDEKKFERSLGRGEGGGRIKRGSTETNTYEGCRRKSVENRWRGEKRK